MVAKSGASIEKFLKGRWCEVNYKQMIKNREKGNCVTHAIDKNQLKQELKETRTGQITCGICDEMVIGDLSHSSLPQRITTVHSLPHFQRILSSGMNY